MFKNEERKTIVPYCDLMWFPLYSDPVIFKDMYMDFKMGHS